MTSVLPSPGFLGAKYSGRLFRHQSCTRHRSGMPSQQKGGRTFRSKTKYFPRPSNSPCCQLNPVLVFADPSGSSGTLGQRPKSQVGRPTPKTGEAFSWRQKPTVPLAVGVEPMASLVFGNNCCVTKIQTSSMLSSESKVATGQLTNLLVFGVYPYFGRSLLCNEQMNSAASNEPNPVKQELFSCPKARV